MAGAPQQLALHLALGLSLAVEPDLPSAQESTRLWLALGHVPLQQAQLLVAWAPTLEPLPAKHSTRFALERAPQLVLGLAQTPAQADLQPTQDVAHLAQAQRRLQLKVLRTMEPPTLAAPQADRQGARRMQSVDA